MDNVILVHDDSSGRIELVLIDTYIPPDLPAKVDISYSYWYLRINGSILESHICTPDYKLFKEPGLLIINAWDAQDLTVDGVIESIQLCRVKLLAYDVVRDQYGLVSRSTTGPMVPTAVTGSTIAFKKAISGVHVEYEVERSRISWLPAQKTVEGFLMD